MAYLFSKVAKGVVISKADRIPSDKERRDWLRSLASKAKRASFKQMHDDNPEPFKRLQDLTENSIGKLYTFSYDPKLKAVLPYYDSYPLVFPIEYYGDGFLGINLHYLPPRLRAQLMDALYDTLNNKKYNKTTKLQISYRLLASASRYSLFKPCIKRYLFNHVKSPFIYISPDEWDIAVMLPTQRFKKKTAEQVWMDSRKQI